MSKGKVNKFNYLFSLLEGNAAHLIKGLTLISANYDTAIEILQERFGKTQQIIAAHIPACPESRTGQLRFVFDKISVHVRVLASLGIAAEQCGSLLIPVIMTKLPSEIRLQIVRKATNDVWQNNDLLKTIKSEIEAREMSEMTRSNVNEKTNKPKQATVPTVGSFAVTGDDKDGAGKFKIKCAPCKELHYSASCKKVIDREARLKLLRD